MKNGFKRLKFSNCKVREYESMCTCTHREAWQRSSFPHTRRRPQNNSNPKGGSTGQATWLSQIHFKPVQSSRALCQQTRLSEMTQHTSLNLHLSPQQLYVSALTHLQRKIYEKLIHRAVISRKHSAKF